MRAAARATREVADEANRTGRRAEQSFEQTRRSTDRMNDAFEEAEESARRQTEAAEDSAEAHTRLTKQTDLARAGLVSMAGGGAAAGAALAGAGVAVVGFAAVAAPSIGRVVTATGDLATEWGSLTRQQQVSALGARDLRDAYQELVDSYEPQALAAFNTVVATGTQLMPKLNQVVGATSGGVQGLIDDLGAFATGPQVDRFLMHVSRTAPEGLDLMGDSLTTTGELGLQLAEDLTPVGTSVLTVLNGVLGLVNGLAHVNPAFAQLAVTALIMRAPMTAAAAGAGALGARMATAGAATGRTATAGRALNTVAKAGPAIWIAAGTALAFWAIKAANAKSDTEKLNEVLRIQNGAIGNNLQGHRVHAQTLQVAADVAMRRFIEAQRQVTQATRDSQDPMRAQSSEMARLRQVVKDSNADLQKQREILKTVETGAGLLSSKYGITTHEALRLAEASGVDLSASLDKSGKLTEQAEKKILQYRGAVELAADPTRQMSLALGDAGNESLLLKDRMTALSTAMDIYFNPSIAVYRATTQVADGMRELTSALGDAHGRLDGNTAASGRLRQAFAGQLQSTADLAAAVFRQTGRLSESNAVIATQLPMLYRLAGGNAEARRQVDALAKSTVFAAGQADISRGAFLRAASALNITEDRALALWKAFNQLRSKRVNVFVDGVGKWKLSGGVGPGMGLTRPGMYAEGGPVPWVHGAVSGRDSVPALMMPDEHVWTTREVDAAGGHQAMYRLRQMALAGKLKGYARGGPVAMDRGDLTTTQVVNRILAPIDTGMVGLVESISRTMADQWRRFVQSGGPVVAAARSQIGRPYSWGGGGKGGPSYGIAHGSNIYGFDCSGLTEYAWWQGKRVDIGGTTYAQHPRTTAISGPRPGALGFNSSLGHVVLASRPGYVIEAPYTGAHVREVAKSMPDWRWPRMAAGGPVERLGEAAVSPHAALSEVALAKLLGIAGDPGRIPRMAGGGWVTGPAGVDRAPVLATAGEYMINRSAAMRSPRLVEDINAGRVGEALLRRYVTGSAAAGGGSAGNAGRRGRGGDTYHFHSHGVIGHRMDVENWLAGALDTLDRQGRLPRGSRGW